MTALSSIIRLLLLFFLALFILMFFYLGIYAPKEQNISKIQKEIKSLEKQTFLLKKEEDKLLSTEKKPAPVLRSIPQELLAELPAKNDVPTLLKTWSEQGKKLGIEFVRFKPLKETESFPIIEMPIEIILQGTFEQTLKFFNALSSNPRKILISNIKMTQPQEKDGSYVISTHALATTFYKSGDLQ